MTTTQMLLIILAVLLVGGIWLYNVLQERRFRRQAERMFEQRRQTAADDPALDPVVAFTEPALADANHTDRKSVV